MTQPAAVPAKPTISGPPSPDLSMPDLLLDVILGLLAPLLMTSGITDARLARLAAEQAVAAYKVAGEPDLVCVAQIVGFAVTALDNLRLSMPADLSLSMKLQLRGNANALTRSSQRASASLHQHRAEPPTARYRSPTAIPPTAIPPTAIPQAEPPEPPPASITPAPITPEAAAHHRPHTCLLGSTSLQG